VVFFGTPEFSVPTLDALRDAGRLPLLVVTQPGRQAGRGRQVRQPAVADWAVRHSVPLLQPASVRDEGFLEELRATSPDLAVVVAFGQIFRRPLLELPRLGCINVHASLLPAWRGASPIAAAIRAGDEVTGVTTMQMDVGLDSGPILLQESTVVGGEEACGELTERLSVMGARLLVQTIEALELGTVVAAPQDHERATFAPLLTRQDSWIDWTLEARAVNDQIRAHDPWPGSRTRLHGKDLMIKKAELPRSGPAEPCGVTGQLLGIAEGALVVECGGGTMVLLHSVQRPGRGPVRGVDLWNGERLDSASRLV
jgi:methionyl-tRNA formyltransferase